MSKELQLKKEYIKMIQTLKYNYFIDDECRKIYLQAQYGKDSLTELNVDELKEVLKLVGYKPYKGVKFIKPVAKKGNASKKQIAMIYAIWQEVARDKSEWALRKFIDRVTGKMPLHLWCLSTVEASDVILGLRNMAKKGKRC
ncbi:DUF1018 domain-containing protein [Campylobacter sp. faydin G-24]|uniref:DUF1018 domain-containing protein n=1 Tax=Campylobacter anatolicus TaxID=2829105 RepID=A0ABS5HH82_9BACT|nr:phage protein GemA/Gp16 family protein [Campylobacter anatolicus]MBR8463639.1 DUF1018 domain-containing protein [Campylobacter anatolicus]